MRSRPRPLSYKRTPIRRFEAYRVNGTPADCVALGVHTWDKVDVVLSGINLGSNLGNSMWHSGTLAAVKQAVLLGLRGITLGSGTGTQLVRTRPSQFPSRRIWKTTNRVPVSLPYR
jgi:5'/3'-nucleotidase SurE